LEKIEHTVDALRARGFWTANRSLVIRLALHALDINERTINLCREVMATDKRFAGTTHSL
jgi:hypothetical protein